MEQTHAPQQQQEASSQSEREEKKQPSRVPMDIMRSLSGADDNGADAPRDKGRRISLSDAMQAKMQRAFGLDMSGVKLYESPAVRDAGANALAQGDTVSFAPGKADFSSRQGETLLGHELSHIATQARGEARGDGLLLDSSLEARADREGAMAAAGKQVAPPSAGLVSAAPVAASPVQGDFSKASEDMLKRKPKHGDPFKKFPRFRYLSSKPSRFKPSRIPPNFGKSGKRRGRGGGGGGGGNSNNFNFTFAPSLMFGGGMGMGMGGMPGMNIFNMFGGGMGGMPMGMGGMFGGMGMGGMPGMPMGGMFGGGMGGMPMGMGSMFGGMGMGMPGMFGMNNMFNMGNGGNGGGNGSQGLSVNVNVNVRDSIEQEKKAERDEKTQKSAQSQATESSTQTTETYGGGGFGGGGGIYDGDRGGGPYSFGGGIYDGPTPEPEPQPDNVPGPPPPTPESMTVPEGPVVQRNVPGPPPPAPESMTVPEGPVVQRNVPGPPPPAPESMTVPEGPVVQKPPEVKKRRSKGLTWDMVPGNKRAVDRFKMGASKSKQIDVYGNLMRRGRKFPGQSGGRKVAIGGPKPKVTPPKPEVTPPKPKIPARQGAAKKAPSGDWKLFKDWQGVKGNNNYFNTSKNLKGAWNRVGIQRGDYTPISRSDPLHTGTINVPKWNRSNSQKRPKWR